MSGTIRAHYTNLVDLASTVIAASSQVSSLPASNVADPQKTRVWRTGSTLSNEWVSFDLGSAQAVTSIVVHNHTLLNTDSALILRYADDAAFTVNVGTVALTWQAATIYQVFGSVSKRYWRLEFTKATAASSRDIGRVFLGVYTTFDRDPDRNGGFKEKTVNRSVTQTSLGGQTYTWARLPFRQAMFQWGTITAAHKAEIDAMVAAVGTYNTLFIYFPGQYDIPLYAKLVDLPDYAITGGVTGAFYYSVSLNFNEQL